MSRLIVHGITTTATLAFVCFSPAAMAQQMSSTDACNQLQTLASRAREAGDIASLPPILEQLVTAACPAELKERIKRDAGLTYSVRAANADLSDSDRAALLREGLRIASPRRPWRMLAWLGDLEMNTKNFEVATQLYSEALDDIRDEDINPVAPSTKVIERIFKRAEQAALLSTTYKSAVNTRTGGAGGLLGGNVRGYTAVKIALPVQFVFAETRFSDQGAEAANGMVEYLRSTAASRIRLTGHTDSRGGRDYNRDLSQRRANALAEYLRKNGFGGEILTEGKGEEEPYVSDGSVALSQELIDRQNRRVELLTLK